MRPKRWFSSERERLLKRTAACGTAFARLAEKDPRVDRTLTRFLARGYQRKEIVDYAIGPQTSVSETQARQNDRYRDSFR